jgi:hypothetical protein
MPSLEQVVASRYLDSLSEAGYQPLCCEADEMLEDALKLMASLNQAQLQIKHAHGTKKPLSGA